MDEAQVKDIVSTIDKGVELILSLDPSPSDQDLKDAKDGVERAQKAVAQAEKLLRDTRKAATTSVKALRAADDGVSLIQRELALRSMQTIDTPFWASLSGILQTCREQLDDIPDSFSESRGELRERLETCSQHFFQASVNNVSSANFLSRNGSLTALAARLARVRAGYTEITSEISRTLPID